MFVRRGHEVETGLKTGTSELIKGGRRTKWVRLSQLVSAFVVSVKLKHEGWNCEGVEMKSGEG